jgi:hypothetical protein
MIRTTTMAKRNTTKNIRKRPRRWLGRNNQEHKRRTTTMAKKK